MKRKTQVRQRRWQPDQRHWKEKLGEGIRGTVHDVAQILDVPPSWVYPHADEIPGLVRTGKYLRWDLRDVVNWRANGRCADEPAR